MLDIITNYLSITKLIKLFEKKNRKGYEKFIQEFKTIKNFIRNYLFFCNLNDPIMHINNLMKLNCSKIDIVSDLHVDQWNPNYNNKYPCGEISNNPYNFKYPESDILVIAGDISDDINISIDTLNTASEYYDKVIFVDGNHEHVHKYPYLYTYDEIYDKIKKNNND